MQEFEYLCKQVHTKNCKFNLQYSRQQGFAPGPTGAPAPSPLPFSPPPRKYFCYATVMQTEKCKLFAEMKKVVNLRHGKDNVVCLCNRQYDAYILIMSLLLHSIPAAAINELRNQQLTRYIQIGSVLFNSTGMTVI